MDDEGEKIRKDDQNNGNWKKTDIRGNEKKGMT